MDFFLKTLRLIAVLESVHPFFTAKITDGFDLYSYL